MLLHDRTSLILAAVDAVVSIVAAIAILTLSGWLTHPHHEGRLLLAGVVTYLPLTLVTSFIGVALCASVARAMDGEHLTLTQALDLATRRLGQILLWSLLATGIAVLLEQIAARVPFGARLLTWLGGIAWGLATLLVLPIIALDNCNTGESIRRSATLMKERWGEGLTGSLVIGAWGIVVGIPLMIVCIALVDSGSGKTGLTVVFAVLVLMSSATWSATRVFTVSLYRYASGAENPGPFAERDLQQPFRKRR